MKRVTIQDIAKEMGLSRNTVAKALSNGNVSPETRQAVVQKACQMGYAKLDDALVEEVMHQKRKTGGGTILVLFNRWQSLFWNTTLAGISDGAKQEGYRMQLYIVNEACHQTADSCCHYFPVYFSNPICKRHCQGRTTHDLL